MTLALASRSLALLGAVLLAAPAEAARPTYSYLQLDYLDSRREANDGGKLEADGGRFTFNVSLEKWLYFTGEYNHADFDDSDQQLRESSLGFGAHTLGDGLQFFAAVTYERSDVFGANQTEEGHGTQFGLRWPVTREIELGADAKWFDFNQGLRLDRHRATAQWRLGRTWATVATYEVLDFPGAIERNWTVGFRAYFRTQYDLRPRRSGAER